jgi:riboflavin kinase / FMN adenylyltransferase
LTIVDWRLQNGCIIHSYRRKCTGAKQHKKMKSILAFVFYKSRISNRQSTTETLSFAAYMQVHSILSNLPKFTNAVVTIGTFDGVHTGHQQIIQQLKDEAQSVGGETVLITFHPHPRIVVAGGKSAVKLLTTLDEKLELFRVQGLQHVVIVPFTDVFANQSAEAYIKDFLVDTFHPHTVIIGYDHKFGKGREGDYHLLEKMADEYRFTLKEIPEHVCNAVTVSSTRIRQAIASNQVEVANEYLGYPYFFEGTVIHGNKLGRTLGYPTANLQPTDRNKMIPADGIYAVAVQIKGSVELLQGMMSIGVRPTVGGIDRVIEVNIFDFDEEIYDQQLRVYVKHFLRQEVKFNNLEELTEQLHKDKAATLEKLQEPAK